MDEPAIRPKPIRKYARINNKCKVEEIDGPSSSVTIACLPVEIILHILSYLSRKDLYAVKSVSKFFERLVCDPCLWRTYEVTNNESDRSEVINELKRMSLLRKFSINDRADCDNILRQLSLTNTKLEILYVSNCTGSTSKLYLRSSYLVRILQRCRNLHTIYIFGSRFRGRKFYQLLGDMGPRLRSVYTLATRLQFCTFIKHAWQIGKNDRETICSTCTGVKTWAPLYYLVTKQDRVSTALIRFLRDDVVEIDTK